MCIHITVAGRAAGEEGEGLVFVEAVRSYVHVFLSDAMER